MNRRTVKSTGKTTSSNLSKSGRKSPAAAAKALDHREGSKALEAHRYVRQHLRSKPADVIKHLTKKVGLTPGTARNWHHTFRKHPIGKVSEAKAN